MDGVTNITFWLEQYCKDRVQNQIEKLDLCTRDFGFYFPVPRLHMVFNQQNYMIRAYAFKRITVDSLCFDNGGSLCSDTERDDEGIRTKIMKWKVVNFKDIIGK